MITWCVMQCYVLNSDQWFTDTAIISVTSLWHALDDFIFVVLFVQYARKKKTRMQIIISVLFVCPPARAYPSIYLPVHRFRFENRWMDLDEFWYERHATDCYIAAGLASTAILVWRHSWPYFTVWRLSELSEITIVMSLDETPNLYF
jgi:hypothetical protein